MNAFVCPSCQAPLSERRNQYGLLWVCTSCHGRAVTLQMLRKITSPALVNQLWQQARTEGQPHNRSCPGCQRKMTEVSIRTGQRAEQLDVCQGCHFIWFDQRELERLPQRAAKPGQTEGSHNDAAETRKLSPEAREAMAMARLETANLKQVRLQTADSNSDRWWDFLMDLLGIPIE